MTEEQNKIETHDIWADDKGDRKKVADDFTKILRKKDTPFVISLDAGFGFGKTFFVTRWVQQLERQGHTAFYFNAWESDYTGEPLVAFAMEFLEFLTEENLVDENAEANENLKLAGTTFISNVAHQIIKYKSLGLVDSKGLTEKLQENTLEQQAGGMAVPKIRAHLELKESVDGLKKNLTEIYKTIEEREGAKPPPIYVMIDELDRCKPSFAIEFLEIIKHFFDVKGLMFIIATDKGQLQHSVKAVYGEGYDGQGYLRRFFDLELSLPEMPTKDFIWKGIKYDMLKEEYAKNSTALRFRFDAFNRSYAYCADFFGLSLRDIQRGLKLTEIVLILMQEAEIHSHPELFAFLIAARQRDIDFYNRLGVSLKGIGDGGVSVILKAARELSKNPEYFNDTYVEENEFPMVKIKKELASKTLESLSDDYRIIRLKKEIEIGVRYTDPLY